MKDASTLRRGMKSFLRKKSEILLAYAFLTVFVVASRILYANFFSLRNINNLILNATPYLFITFAQTIVILMGGTDLSVGSLVSVACVVSASLMRDEPGGFVLPVLVTLSLSTLTGVINGALIAKGGLQPIVATLAVSTILSGLALVIMPAPGGTVHAGYARFLTGTINKTLSRPLLLGAALTAVMYLVLNRTRFGKSVYAIGGNLSAAYSSGIPVDRVRIMAFGLVGLLCGLGGLFMNAVMYSGDPKMGDNLTMNTITCAVLGGTALSGGKGGVIGSVAGVYILMIINNMLNMMGVPSFYQYVIQGGLLIVALGVGSLKVLLRNRQPVR